MSAERTKPPAKKVRKLPPESVTANSLVTVSGTVSVGSQMVAVKIGGEGECQNVEMNVEERKR